MEDEEVKDEKPEKPIIPGSIMAQQYDSDSEGPTFEDGDGEEMEDQNSGDESDESYDSEASDESEDKDIMDIGDGSDESKEGKDL